MRVFVKCMRTEGNVRQPITTRWVDRPMERIVTCFSVLKYNSDITMLNIFCIQITHTRTRKWSNIWTNLVSFTHSFSLLWLLHIFFINVRYWSQCAISEMPMKFSTSSHSMNRAYLANIISKLHSFSFFLAFDVVGKISICNRGTYMWRALRWRYSQWCH